MRYFGTKCALFFAVGLFACSTLFAQVTIPLVNKSDWKIEAGNPAIAWLGSSGGADRGGTYNPKTDHVIVTPRTGTPQGILLDAASGVEVGKLNFTGVSGGTFPTNEVVVTPDGQIFIANLSATPASVPIKVYYWKDETAAPLEVFNSILEGARYGDGLGIAGNGTNITVYISGSGNDRIAALKWDATAQKLSANGYLIPEPTKARARYGIAPIPGTNTAWINGPATKLARIDLTTGAILNEVEADVATLGLGDLTYFTNAGRSYVVSGPNFDGNPAPMDFWVIDVTNPLKARLVAKIEGVTKNANGNATGFVAWDSKRGNVITMSSNNHIASYPFVFPAVANEDNSALASAFVLNGNYPNPFNPSTTISFDLEQVAQVSVTVMDVTGREVMNVPARVFAAGKAQTIQLNASNLPSGAYLYRLTARSNENSMVRTGMMTLVK